MMRNNKSGCLCQRAGVPGQALNSHSELLSGPENKIKVEIRKKSKEPQ